MADVERISPPVPTLPSPVGRSVGSKQRRAPRGDRPPQERRSNPQPADRKPGPDHIDEYV
jgi:hypothetical protein